MNIKKRIKVNPIKIADKQLYEKFVSICPICGENVLEHKQSTLFTDNVDNDWLYKITKRTITVKCPECGCQWRVKPFKE